MRFQVEVSNEMSTASTWAGRRVYALFLRHGGGADAACSDRSSVPYFPKLPEYKNIIAEELGAMKNESRKRHRRLTGLELA